MVTPRAHPGVPTVPRHIPRGELEGADTLTGTIATPPHPKRGAPRPGPANQGPEKHTNRKDNFQEAGFCVSGPKAT